MTDSILDWRTDVSIRIALKPKDADIGRHIDEIRRRLSRYGNEFVDISAVNPIRDLYRYRIRFIFWGADSESRIIALLSEVTDIAFKNDVWVTNYIIKKYHYSLPAEQAFSVKKNAECPPKLTEAKSVPHEPETKSAADAGELLCNGKRFFGRNFHGWLKRKC